MGTLRLVGQRFFEVTLQVPIAWQYVEDVGGSERGSGAPIREPDAALRWLSTSTNAAVDNKVLPIVKRLFWAPAFVLSSCAVFATSQP
jgi:hypothetical protein